MHTSRRKRILLVLLTGLASTLACLAGAELVLRARGVRPWRTDPVDIRVEPGGTFFRSHPKLGYTHIPGRFTVTLPTGYSFHVTNGPDTLRITSAARAEGRSREKEKIWVFGCSFTHGWSLNDEETYPWLLQAEFAEYDVVNFGACGYGTIHSLIQFKDALESKRPKVAVLAYADFHDKRNTFLRIRGKTVAPWNKLGPIVQPYARFDRAGNLSYGMADVAYAEFPLMRYSALSHYIETNYNALEERRNRSHEVSEALIAEMARLATEHGVKFVVAGLNRGSKTLEMLQFAQARGIASVDISVDLSIDGNTNAPHADHPSAFANRQYADKLGTYLRSAIGDGSSRRQAQPQRGQ